MKTYMREVQGKHSSLRGNIEKIKTVNARSILRKNMKSRCKKSQKGFGISTETVGTADLSLATFAKFKACLRSVGDKIESAEKSRSSKRG